MTIHALASMTWPEVRDLPADQTVAILPTGAVEAHGPHLPLGTDIIIAEAMARAGAERLAARGLQVLVLPVLPIAPAPFASEFPGTLHVAAEATTLIVTSIVRSLRVHGVQVTAIANAHHDPAHVHALRIAVDEVAASGGGLLVFPDLTRRRWAERLTPEFQSGACHAGRYEGSVVLAERPGVVRRELLPDLPPNPRSLVDAVRRGHETFSEAGGSDAYFGYPADASADEGRTIVAMLGAILDEAVTEALERRKPHDMTEHRKTPREQADEAEGHAPTSVLEVVNPHELGAPRGFAHGILAPAGARVLFVAGQTAAGSDGRITATDFPAQFETALERVIAVVRAAGGTPAGIARMTVYVTSMQQYRNSRPALRTIWTRRIGARYPSMTLVEVTALADEGAAVEIDALAVVP